ncbi:hypothetical protein [Paraurantiacibacter namhicola]|uniref:Uncharacterized protein n=1 Tax=Paraurantiacibacter namhicola TaxID=645517 RepID=A0A1C7DAY5_9SPHN|nr:hypothetical protein [Paraurantiacibacter namhicola]ANU08481.1 hypothetical protein A6F65_02196 [Paraurantiacibacter namhicola]
MTLRQFTMALALAAMPVSAGTVHAQVTATEVITGEESVQIAFSEQRGRQMYLYDQAAWHATDALLDEVDASAIANPRGYVVLERDGDNMLDAVFLQDVDGQMMEFARYTVDGSTVTGGGARLGDPQRLSPLAVRMAQARVPALAAMVEEEFGLCSDSSPNTLTLPPDEEGNIPFYLLTSTLEEASYPIGGHYLATIDAGGQVVSTTRYMNTCFDLPFGAPDAPEASSARPGISYVRGPVPSEIHVFTSFYFPDGYYVITTANNSLWLVEQGRITLEKRGFGLD